jgi:hypothetical protein
MRSENVTGIDTPRNVFIKIAANAVKSTGAEKQVCKRRKWGNGKQRISGKVDTPGCVCKRISGKTL